MTSGMKLGGRRLAMALLSAAAIGATIGRCVPVRAERPASGLPAEKPAEVGLKSEPLDAIAGDMKAFVEKGQAAGTVTLVVRKGRVVHLAAVGKADLKSDREMTPQTMFAIASMTKPITGAALMILHDEGKVALDDPVAKYIPEFKESTVKGEPLQRDITLRHLLTHTSGLGGEQRNMGTLAETAVALAKRPLDFQPGDRWQYSPGLSVIGRVVEIVSKKPFDDFLNERFFRPLEMHDTTFIPNENHQKRIARLYQPGDEPGALKPGEHWLLDFSSTTSPNPSGGLFSTAADLARFYQMILNGGELDGRRILSEAAVKELTTIHTGELATGFTPGNGWGLGWCVVREPQGATESLSAGSHGHGGAFGTQGWIDPQREMVYVLLVQRTNFGNGDASNLRQALQRRAEEAVK